MAGPTVLVVYKVAFAHSVKPSNASYSCTGSMAEFHCSTPVTSVVPVLCKSLK
jgi:hypothetical protein